MAQLNINVDAEILAFADSILDHQLTDMEGMETDEDGDITTSNPMGHRTCDSTERNPNSSLTLVMAATPDDEQPQGSNTSVVEKSFVSGSQCTLINPRPKDIHRKRFKYELDPNQVDESQRKNVRNAIQCKKWREGQKKKLSETPICSRLCQKSPEEFQKLKQFLLLNYNISL